MWRKNRDPDAGDYHFKECLHSWKDKKTGKTVRCNYTTTNMDLTHCPSCGAYPLRRAY